MNIGYHNWESPILSHGTELKVYGHSGQAMLIFPSSRGRFFDYENNGMIEVIREYIENGTIMVFTIDGIDWQTWFNDDAHPADKARRHHEYRIFLREEVVPFIFNYSGVDLEKKLIVSGCSFGAYHSVNFFVHYPDVVSAVIALSGVYSVQFSVGEYDDENVLHGDSIRFVREQQDQEMLKSYRDTDIILCVGQGAWEDWMLEETKRLSEVFHQKDINHWLDIWGHDVNHDWVWWRKMMPYFLNKIINNERYLQH